MHGGACMVGGGEHAWWGACMARGACMAGGMYGKGACTAGGHVWQGACVAGGSCMAGGHAWLLHMVNERAVCILLECILVKIQICQYSHMKQQGACKFEFLEPSMCQTRFSDPF